MRLFVVMFFLALPLCWGKAFGVPVDQSLDKIEETLKTAPELAFAELEEFKSIPLSKAQNAKFDMLKGIYFIFKADYAKASAFFESAWLQTSDATQKVKILGYVATVNLIQKQYPESMEAIATMLSLINAIDDRDIQRSAYIRLASLYSQMGLFEQVGVYASKALSLASADAVKDICYSYLYIAVSSMRGDANTNSIKAFEKTQAYCAEHGLPLIAIMATKGMGEVYLVEEKYSLSIILLEKALAQYSQFGFAIEIPSTQSLLAKAFLKLENMAKASTLASAVIGNVAADENALSDAWFVLAEVAAKRGDYKGAFEAQQKQAEYASRLNSETKAREMAYQAAKFNYDEQKREISLLNTEREGYLVRQETISREHSGSLMASTLLMGVCCFLLFFLLLGISQRKRLIHLAERDGLTGTYNRATGQEKSENALVSCMAAGKPAALILLDLDYFKRINDEFGHGTGDWALKKSADVLRHELGREPKTEHILCRFGGEEFMIMLPGISGAEAYEIAERCRLSISTIDTQYSGHQFSLSASFGISELSSEDLSLDPMLVRADKALYLAKHSGRNRVELDSE